MQNDRTRLWAGLAAVAVAVAVFGSLRVRSASSASSQGNPDAESGRIALAGYRPESTRTSQVALRQRVRDYQSEVTAALARQNANPTASPNDDDNAEEDIFDVDPLDGIGSRPSDAPPGEIPNPTDFAASGSPNPTAYTTEGPVATTSPAGNADAPSASGVPTSPYSGDDYGQSGTMSDSDVYRLVVTNLSDGQRQDFTRAYSAMSAEQRADLLDGFRQQIQGDP